MTAAVDVYAAGLASPSPLVLHDEHGRTRVLPVSDWTAEEVPGDAALVARCEGAVLDIGCGPGRLLVALGLLGRPALGVDIAPAAVRMARSRGGLALPRSVFARLPGHGRWDTALLADGNVGIGGDPPGLLRRAGQLLRPGGRALVELEPPGGPRGPVRVRVAHEGLLSDWFDWAHVPADDAHDLARAAGLELHETWTGGDRWFAAYLRT